MPRILVTGMSGTGKSTALAALENLGYRTVDTDYAGRGEWSETAGGYMWAEDRMTELLADDSEDRPLFVSGTVSNQGRFYDRFDAVVLLSAPAEVLLSRIRARTTNAYGKTPMERAFVLRDLVAVEPLLPRACTHELDASMPPAWIVDRLVDLAHGRVT